MTKRSTTSSIARLQTGLISVMLAFYAAAAPAADHFLQSGNGSFNGSSVRPGDTITLQSGTRGPLTISNLRGSAQNPIVIQNDKSGNGPTVIRQTSGSGAVFRCVDCKYVIVDGSRKWSGAPEGKTYGIKVTMSGGSVTHFVRFEGLSSDYTVRYIEIDGRYPAQKGSGIGISINDHTYQLSDHPGQWRQNILIEHNYVHNTGKSGLYLGPNWPKGSLPLRNIEVAHNLVEDLGYDGIKLKSAIEGRNSIHHNVVRRTGLSPTGEGDGNTSSGIFIFESGAEVYNNWVEDVSGVGPAACYTQYMQHLPRQYGPQRVAFYNNVAINCQGNGINSARADSSLALPVASIRNNTILRAGGTGIRINARAAAACEVVDNISVGNGGSDISVGDECTGVVANNRTGSPTNVRFVDASRSDLRLQASSPAVDDCHGTEFPPFDHADVRRAQGATCDQGAFEYSTGGDKVAVRPNPPEIVFAE